MKRAQAALVILLVSIGVAASLGRTIFLSDFATRVEPGRREILRVLGRNDPFAEERTAELPLFDGRYRAHSLATLLHVIPGGLFLLLAPLQFSSRVRSRHIRFHRWSGRLLVLAAVTAASTGLYFGLLLPFAGKAESAAIAVFGGLLLYSLGTALVAIRGRDVARHREWMIRAFSLCLAISSVRIVAAVVDLTLTPSGLSTRLAFVLSLWTGWLLTLAAAEFWIRHPRSRTA